MNWLLAASWAAAVGGVAEVLGTEFPAGNSHEIRMKFIGLARVREGGRERERAKNKFMPKVSCIK